MSTNTIQVTFSQPGLTLPRADFLSMVHKAFPRAHTHEAIISQGYADSRTILTAAVPVNALPSALVYFTRQRGHASTSVGSWLMDATISK